MGETKIEWADVVWNPTTGCSKVSEGCRNCYAARLWPRLRAMGNNVYQDRNFNDVRCHTERLDQPLSWTKPKRIFVNSMSDLFHEDVPFEFIGEVFANMHNSRQHTFMILTKRPKRMQEFIQWYIHEWLVGFESAWPREYQHVWLGVSVENQAMTDERIPLLLQTPAAVKFISAEPLLGPINLINIDAEKAGHENMYFINSLTGDHHDMGRPCKELSKLDWVICGSESGTKSRPMKYDWAYSLSEQCENANIPFFYKQGPDDEGKVCKMPRLKGLVWNQIPEVRV